MKLTLNRIREHRPCQPSWEALLKSLNKTKADNVDFDLMYILKVLGIEDAAWCLRCFDYLEICLFMADIAENVLPIFEANYKSKAPRRLIQAIRDYKAGIITHDTLEIFRQVAANVAVDINQYTTTSAASSAAEIATNSALTSYLIAISFGIEPEKIEKLFVKHFG